MIALSSPRKIYWYDISKIEAISIFDLNEFLINLVK